MTTTSEPNSHPPESQPEDPIDVLVALVPRHIWVSVAALMTMVLLGLMLFRTPIGRSTGAALPAELNAGRDTTLEGRVVAILSEGITYAGEPAPGVQTAHVEIIRGNLRGTKVDIEYGSRIFNVPANRLRQGDRVLVEYADYGPDGDYYYISDFVRLPALLVQVALFAAVAIAVGGWVGLRALVSVGISVLAFAVYFLPGITAGYDPLLIAVTGSILLMTASLYLIYQWHWKTHAALLGITLSLILASVATVAFAELSRLSGLGAEETVMLLQSAQASIDARGLLWAGILIGAVGVLDDVAIGQASATFELKRANPSLGWHQLFHHGMVIGRDHIASMINTLLLAYVGASLPLFLLLTAQELPLLQTMSREFLAEEIVRTLVGSLALILAVPITSLIASLVASSQISATREVVREA